MERNKPGVVQKFCWCLEHLLGILKILKEKYGTRNLKFVFLSKQRLNLLGENDFSWPSQEQRANFLLFLFSAAHSMLRLNLNRSHAF